jgi:hypothetical protein
MAPAFTFKLLSIVIVRFAPAEVRLAAARSD